MHFIYGLDPFGNTTQATYLTGVALNSLDRDPPQIPLVVNATHYIIGSTPQQ
jgi:hypothetical protein